MLTKIKNSYKEYPNPFKVLVLSTFIDRLGFFLMFPFFALYVTAHFNVGIIQVGFIFAVFSAGGIIGGILGGALADKYGRRAMILIGLIASGVSSIFMGLVDDLNIFYIVAAIAGLMAILEVLRDKQWWQICFPKKNKQRDLGFYGWLLIFQQWSVLSLVDL